MPFPFFWVGALVAGFVLTGVLTLFGIAEVLLERAAHEVRASVLPGLVSGFRGWSAAGGPVGPRRTSPRAAEGPGPFEEIPPRDGPPVAKIRARVH